LKRSRLAAQVLLERHLDHRVRRESRVD